MMPATTLAFYQLNAVIAENQIDFLIERHRRRHVGKKGFQALHDTTSRIFGATGAT
jgi:hypothetical protein